MKKHFLRAVALTAALCTLPLFGCSESGKGQGDVNLDDTQIVQPEKPENDEFGTGKVSLAKYSLTDAGRAEEKIISEVFSEAGKNNGKYRLVFAAAVKGDVGAVTIKRKAITGTSAEEKTKTCENFYEGIRRGDKIYYYDSVTQSMTTDSSKKGEFYWAVYTVEFASDSYYEKDITVDFKPANLDETKTTTQNLKAEALSSIELEMVGKEDEEINLYTGVELDLQIQAWQFGQTVTPTVTDSADENSITDGKFSSTVTGAHTITVRYEDPDISDFFVQQTRTINVGRKLFKTVKSNAELTIDEYKTDGEQSVVCAHTNVLNANLNMDAGKKYYVEAEFTVDRLKNGTTDQFNTNNWFGFGHFAEGADEGSGQRVYTTIKPFDRKLQCADSGGSINDNSVTTSGNVNDTFGVYFKNKYAENAAIRDGEFVKVGALRIDNVIYNFFDDQYVGSYNLPDWCKDVNTQPALYINNYGGDSDTTVKNIQFMGENELTVEKLNELTNKLLISKQEGEFTLEFDYKLSGTASSGQQMRVVVKSADADINATSHLEFGANYGERKFTLNYDGYNNNKANPAEESTYVGVTPNDYLDGKNRLGECYFNDYSLGCNNFSEPNANTEKQYTTDKVAHFKLTRKLVGEEGAKKNEYTMEVSFDNAAGVKQTFSRKIVLSNTPTGINYGTGNGAVIVHIQLFNGIQGELTNLNWSIHE